jgi:N-acetylneuraminic acid mutarotase
LENKSADVSIIFERLQNTGKFGTGKFVIPLHGKIRLEMNVLEFDLSTNEFKAMPPLPCGLSYMAGVHWGDQAILIGGSDDNGQSKKVFMYNSKTGNTN